MIVRADAVETVDEISRGGCRSAGPKKRTGRIARETLVEGRAARR